MSTSYKNTSDVIMLWDRDTLSFGTETYEILTAGNATITLDDALTAMFQIQDLDKSGFITMEESLEFDKLFSEVSGVQFDEAETKETFAQTDANKDGKVSLEEFKAYFKKTASEAGMDESAQLGLVRQTNQMMLVQREEDFGSLCLE
jgi:Ca2+-binding EF-hand superfamily protein